MMTEDEIISLGFQRVYLDNNCDIIENPTVFEIQKLIDNGNFYFYELTIRNGVYFSSHGGNEDVINNNWTVDFGLDLDDLAEYKIESYDTVKQIIDFFNSIDLKIKQP